MGYHSILFIVISVFTILFSLMYASSLLNYRIPHEPNTIPTSPILSQAQALAIVETEYRKNVPGFKEAYLHLQYYNYSKERAQDEEYQNYLLTLTPGWRLSVVKENPSLLSLTVVFVHANGTIYSIDPQSRTFEKVCEKPSIDCPFGNAARTARDRLVYEVGAIVEGSDGYDSDVHYIIDAETGSIVYHIPYFNPRPPLPHRFIIANSTQTVNELQQQIDNARFGAAIAIEKNAPEMAGKEGTSMKGYNPPDVIVTLNNNTDAITITWFNHDAIAHTVTSDDGYSDLLARKLDSGMIEPGGNYAFVFTEEGPYQYHCRIHPWMKGSISIHPRDFT